MIFFAGIANPSIGTLLVTHLKTTADKTRVSCVPPLPSSPPVAIFVVCVNENHVPLLVGHDHRKHSA